MKPLLAAAFLVAAALDARAQCDGTHGKDSTGPQREGHERGTTEGPRTDGGKTDSKLTICTCSLKGCPVGGCGCSGSSGANRGGKGTTAEHTVEIPREILVPVESGRGKCAYTFESDYEPWLPAKLTYGTDLYPRPVPLALSGYDVDTNYIYCSPIGPPVITIDVPIITDGPRVQITTEGSCGCCPNATEATDSVGTTTTEVPTTTTEKPKVPTRVTQKKCSVPAIYPLPESIDYVRWKIEPKRKTLADDPLGWADLLRYPPALPAADLQIPTDVLDAMNEVDRAGFEWEQAVEKAADTDAARQDQILKLIAARAEFRKTLAALLAEYLAAADAWTGARAEQGGAEARNELLREERDDFEALARSLRTTEEIEPLLRDLLDRARAGLADVPVPKADDRDLRAVETEIRDAAEKFRGTLEAAQKEIDRLTKELGEALDRADTLSKAVLDALEMLRAALAEWKKILAQKKVEAKPDDLSTVVIPPALLVGWWDTHIPREQAHAKTDEILRLRLELEKAEDEQTLDTETFFAKIDALLQSCDGAKKTIPEITGKAREFVGTGEGALLEAWKRVDELQATYLGVLRDGVLPERARAVELQERVEEYRKASEGPRTDVIEGLRSIVTASEKRIRELGDSIRQKREDILSLDRRNGAALDLARLELERLVRDYETLRSQVGAAERAIAELTKQLAEKDAAFALAIEARSRLAKLGGHAALDHKLREFPLSDDRRAAAAPIREILARVEPSEEFTAFRSWLEGELPKVPETPVDPEGVRRLKSQQASLASMPAGLTEAQARIDAKRAEIVRREADHIAAVRAIEDAIAADEKERRHEEAKIAEVRSLVGRAAKTAREAFAKRLPGREDKIRALVADREKAAGTASAKASEAEATRESMLREEAQAATLEREAELRGKALAGILGRATQVRKGLRRLLDEIKALSADLAKNPAAQKRPALFAAIESLFQLFRGLPLQAKGHAVYYCPPPLDFLDSTGYDVVLQKRKAMEESREKYREALKKLETLQAELLGLFRALRAQLLAYALADKAFQDFKESTEDLRKQRDALQKRLDEVESKKKQVSDRLRDIKDKVYRDLDTARDNLSKAESDLKKKVQEEFEALEKTRSLGKEVIALKKAVDDLRREEQTIRAARDGFQIAVDRQLERIRTQKDRIAAFESAGKDTAAEDRALGAMYEELGRTEAARDREREKQKAAAAALKAKTEERDRKVKEAIDQHSEYEKKEKASEEARKHARRSEERVKEASERVNEYYAEEEKAKAQLAKLDEEKKPIEAEKAKVDQDLREAAEKDKAKKDALKREVEKAEKEINATITKRDTLLKDGAKEAFEAEKSHLEARNAYTAALSMWFAAAKFEVKVTLIYDETGEDGGKVSRQVLSGMFPKGTGGGGSNDPARVVPLTFSYGARVLTISGFPGADGAEKRDQCAFWTGVDFRDQFKKPKNAPSIVGAGGTGKDPNADPGGNRSEGMFPFESNPQGFDRTRLLGARATIVGKEPVTTAMLHPEAEGLFRGWAQLPVRRREYLGGEILRWKSDGKTTDLDVSLYGCTPDAACVYQAIKRTEAEIAMTSKWSVDAGSAVTSTEWAPMVFWKLPGPSKEHAENPGKLKAFYLRDDTAHIADDKIQDSPPTKLEWYDGVLIDVPQKLLGVPGGRVKLAPRIAGPGGAGIDGMTVRYSVSGPGKSGLSVKNGAPQKSASVTTEKGGVAEAEFVFAEPGIWKITVEFAGAKIELEARTPLRVRTSSTKFLYIGFGLKGWKAAAELWNGGTSDLPNAAKQILEEAGKDPSAFEAIVGLTDQLWGYRRDKTEEALKTSPLNDAVFEFEASEAIAGKEAKVELFGVARGELEKTPESDADVEFTARLKEETHRKLTDDGKGEVKERRSAKKVKRFKIGAGLAACVEVVPDEELTPENPASGKAKLSFGAGDGLIAQALEAGLSQIQVTMKDVVVGAEPEPFAREGEVTYEGNHSFQLRGFTVTFVSLTAKAGRPPVAKFQIKLPKVGGDATEHVITVEVALSLNGFYGSAQYQGRIGLPAKLAITKLDIVCDFSREISPEGQPNAFTGVFLRAAVLELPEAFKDENGVPGTISVRNLYYSEGKFGGDFAFDGRVAWSIRKWQFELTLLRVAFADNKLTRFELHGGVTLGAPFEGRVKAEMEIRSVPAGFDLKGSLRTEEPVKMPSLELTVEIKNSTISWFADKRLTVIEVAGSLSSSKFGTFEVEQFRWSSDGDVKFAGNIPVRKTIRIGSGFQLTIDKVSFKVDRSKGTTDASITIDGELILPGIGANAKGKNQLAGSVTVSNGPKLSFALQEAKISISRPPVEISATIVYTDDRFEGTLTADLKAFTCDGTFIIGTAGEAEDSFTYWFAKLSLGSKKGIPIGTTGLQLNKIAGGMGMNYVPPTFTSEGGPARDAWTFLAGVGISDLSGQVFQGDFTMTLVVGDSQGRFSLAGEVSLTRMKESVHGKGELHLAWKPMPMPTFDGGVESDTGITGAVFLTLRMASDGKVVRVEGESVFRFSPRAKFFRCKVKGVILDRAQADAAFSLVMDPGRLNARLWGGMSYGIEPEVKIFGKTVAKAYARASGKVDVRGVVGDSIEFNGSVEATVAAGVEVDLLLGSISASGEGFGRLKVEYKAGKLKVSGKARIAFDIVTTIHAEVDVTYES